ncbi:MAG: helix-turn-helix transcriptional regulator [Dysgonamonadaceae bacterium]|jgi:transcriptional regulator with XRE-family HTH domain|nr:helix-turn-helix transcriptional regulator [Dysgonamonadaceae bacterium]
MNNIGNNIKTFRELKNFSQEYMADALGLTQATLSRIENGQTSVKMDRLQLIADFLEVDLSTLLSATNNFHFVFNNVANQSGYNYINNQTNSNVDIEIIRKIIQEELGKIR